MANTKQDQDSANRQSLSFEEALAQLQEIVGDLEQGKIGLEESMRRYECGVSLLRTCYRILETAEQRIEVLTGVDADGNSQTAAFDAAATVDGAARVPRRRPAADAHTAESTADSENEQDEDDAATLF